MFFDREFHFLNLDITHRCPLECHLCGRQTSFRNHGEKVPGKDLSLESFEKITDFFPRISFCGQYSDPIHHPKFYDLLEICKSKKTLLEIHVASSFKPYKWFMNAFKKYPDAEWVFGIDGLPHQSHLYRKNQDGEKLFQIMKESHAILNNRPKWQYIIFSYNEDKVDEAIAIANEIDVEFHVINSSRFQKGDDFKPKGDVKYGS
jgi:MoaA/NifB/PqqE/SkfB family radical SAM enzyme